MKFYSESKEDVLKELSVNRDRGLSSDDVKSRRDKYGLNEFTPMEEGSFWDDLKERGFRPFHAPKLSFLNGREIKFLQTRHWFF